MQAFIFGLAGVVLGVLTAQIGSRALRIAGLVVCSLAGLRAVIFFNAFLTQRLAGAPQGNLLLGGYVFLLGLWYFHWRALARRTAHTAPGVAASDRQP
jgi:hypothetical protein